MQQIAQAKSRADDVEAKLKAGASFEEMAKQLSGGQTAAKGGDLGEFKRGALGSSALEDPVFALQAGEWTAPIRTRQGFVVLKVTEHTQAGIPPLSAVERQVQEAIYSEAIQPALRTYLTGLREKAYIDIAPGFVDTGASAKQTKPVFSAYAPPAAKKKEAQKARLDHGRAATGSTAGCCGVAATAGSAAARVRSREPRARRRRRGRLCRREDQDGGRGQEAQEDSAGEDPLRAGPAELASGLAGGDDGIWRRPGTGRRPERAARAGRGDCADRADGGCGSGRRTACSRGGGAEEDKVQRSRADRRQGKKGRGEGGEGEGEGRGGPGPDGRGGEGGAADAVRAAGTEWRYGGQEKEEAGEGRSEGAAAGTGPRAAQAQARGDADSAEERARERRAGGEPAAAGACGDPADAQPSAPASPAATAK